MPDADPTPRLPEHETTYRRLRDLLLFGALAPGQKVTIQGLVADLGAGMTPVREAIRRLTAEGALEPQGNRRVLVPRLTLAQLDELAFARLAIEPQLARRACARMSDAAAAALAALDAEIDAAILAGDVAGYLRGNYRFHFALYDTADAPILRGIAQGLWLRTGPSLRVVVEAGGPHGPDRHREALAALQSGDAQTLAEALAQDIRQGLDRIRTEIRGQG
jgi:DNA-binding GntR family transcriptional regulator